MQSFVPYEGFGMACALRLKMSYFIDILLFRQKLTFLQYQYQLYQLVFEGYPSFFIIIYYIYNLLIIN